MKVGHPRYNRRAGGKVYCADCPLSYREGKALRKKCTAETRCPTAVDYAERCRLAEQSNKGRKMNIDGEDLYFSDEPGGPDTRPLKGGWAAGNYINECLTCGGYFTGDKRAISCAACAYGDSHDAP